MKFILIPALLAMAGIKGVAAQGKASAGAEPEEEDGEKPQGAEIKAKKILWDDSLPVGEEGDDCAADEETGKRPRCGDGLCCATLSQPEDPEDT